ADFHAADVEVDIADRECLTVDAQLRPLAGWPGFEPAGLVVNAVSRQVALGYKTEDFPVCRQAGGIELRVVEQDGQPQRDHDALGMRQDLLQDLPGSLSHGRRMKGVLA